MDKLTKRLIKRENGIRDWLKNNKFESLLEKADQILDGLPREEIKKEFEEDIKLALQHCIENDEIKALDFQWFYDGSNPGGAYAYGIDSVASEGNLSKTDLGPDELPGIELELDHGCLIDEDFAELATSTAISELVDKINPIIEQMKESKEHNDSLSNKMGDLDDVITDYFQIWNYKIGCEACQKLKGSNLESELKSRAPFWVTMTRHGRWPVAIMLIE